MYIDDLFNIVQKKVILQMYYGTYHKKVFLNLNF